MYRQDGSHSVLFGDLLADRQQLAARGQGLLLDLAQVVHDVHSLEMVGLRPAAVARPPAVHSFRLFCGGRRGGGRLLSRGRFRQRLGEQQQLIRVELFAAAAVEPPQQQVQVMLQAVALFALAAECCQELQHELPQRGRVVRQRVQIRQRQGIRAHASVYAPARKRFRSPSRIPKMFLRGPLASRRKLVTWSPFHTRQIHAV
jgi:hypothetical protein